MKMQMVILLASTILLTLPLAAQAQSKPTIHAKAIHAKTAMYECPICHHKVDAAQAKSLHYTCPVDHGKLALVKTANLHK